MGLLSGLFGGSQKTEVKLPGYIEDASQDVLGLANQLAGIGYVPNYGPEVAAFTPMQEAAFRNTNRMANAFGMGSGQGAMAGVPRAQTFAGGVRGYSSAPLMNEAIRLLKQRNPAQYEMIRNIMQQMRDRAAGQDQAGQEQPGLGGPATWDDSPEGSRQGWSGGGGNLGFGDLRDIARGNIGGYGGWRDMIDGGGPGASGGWRGDIFG